MYPDRLTSGGFNSRCIEFGQVADDLLFAALGFEGASAIHRCVEFPWDASISSHLFYRLSLKSPA